MTVFDQMPVRVDGDLDQAVGRFGAGGELRLLALHRSDVGHLLLDKGQHLGQLMAALFVAQIASLTKLFASVVVIPQPFRNSRGAGNLLHVLPSNLPRVLAAGQHDFTGY